MRGRMDEVRYAAAEKEYSGPLFRLRRGPRSA